MAEVIGAVDFGDNYFRPHKLNGDTYFSNYTWIFVVDIIFAFFAAYGIGANDVANAFGTSVGSKTLTMRQALCIAAVFEWTGAFFLGAEVTRTISGGIAKGYKFARDPELLMFGMMCADLGVAIWLWIATYLELPVSTTHSIVGAVIGMTLVLKGGRAVYWHTRLVPRKFPYIGGVSMIVISWFTSPVLAAIAASFMFFLVRTFCLRAKNPFDRTFIVIPIVVVIAVSINLMFLIKKGAVNQGSGELSTAVYQGAAWGSGAFCGLVVACLMPWLKRRILRQKAEREQAALEAKVASPDVVVDDDKDGKTADSENENSAPKEVPKSYFGQFLANTIDRDIHTEGLKSQKVQDVWDNAEVFDEDAEAGFKYLQVLSACCNSLSHGANDVANAIGPLAAVHQIWATGNFNSRSPVERWVLVVGGTGIVVGLATYGYNIMRALGVKLTRITASRGFCMELGASMVVLVATNYGLPVSTTHCIVGATLGVGALEGIGGVNWLLFLRMAAGWVMTLVMAGGITAGIVAIGAYSPSVQMSKSIQAYEDGLRVRSEAFTWAMSWEAQVNSINAPGVVQPANFSSDGKSYFAPVVPDAPADGVLNDKFYKQWRPEFMEDAGVWSRSTSWRVAWGQTLGLAPPGWSGLNTSTVEPRGSPSVFDVFDRFADIAFSPNQVAQIQSILAGEKQLCCEETYKCCPRKCKYNKVEESCLVRCEMVKDDPTCVETGCDEPVSGSSTAAKYCKLIEPTDKCPMPMSETNTKNYVTATYINKPQTNSTIYAPSEAVDWREDDIDLSLQLCPVKI